MNPSYVQTVNLLLDIAPVVFQTSRFAMKVTVRSDGRYAFEGQSYKSLSAIAKLITGTQWSGPAFFGLKVKKA